MLLNCSSKSSISGQLKSIDCVIAACDIIKLILISKSHVCCWKCLQCIIHQHTQSSWDYTKYPILPVKFSSNTGLLLSAKWTESMDPKQYRQVGSDSQDDNANFDLIQGLLQTQAHCSKSQKGANTAAGYQVPLVTARTPQMLQL